MIRFVMFLAMALTSATLCRAAAKTPAAPPPPPPYGVLARLVVENPVVVRAEIRKQTLAKPAAGAAPLPPGEVRLLLEARVAAVLAAPAALPETIRIIWQGPADAKGKPPRLVKRAGLMFLTGSGRDAVFGLAASDNILAVDPATDAMVTAIVRESRQSAWRGLRLTGISEAFSQQDDPPFVRRAVFFVSTLAGAPVSLYLRAHGDDPQRDEVLFTTSDIIANVKPVEPRTLAWFYLACTLPRRLPRSVIEAQPSEADAAFLEADYERIFAKLGRCP